MRMQARHDVDRLGSSVDMGGGGVGWVVCKLLQSGALVCGCGQRLCGSIEREFRASKKSPGRSKLVARQKVSACQLLSKKV